jgi:hypothetical protein
MMGIVVPETCWASNKICNKNHLLHLDGILFPHINDDARSKSHQMYDLILFYSKSVHFFPNRIQIYNKSIPYLPTGSFLLIPLDKILFMWSQ